MSDAALLFAFFLAGASAAFFCAVQAPAFSEPRLFFCGLMALVLLLSPSGLGCFLLPFCALLLGLFLEQGAVPVAEIWLAERRLDPFVVVPGLVLVPIFFLAAAHGMTASAAVQTALRRGSPTARIVFGRELTYVFVLVLLALAAIFYFY